MSFPAANGSFALVLHAHQPFVLGYNRWPHGSDWLCEAVVESYLPLLGALRAVVADGFSPQLTLSLSPVLCEQLASPMLQEELQIFLDTRLRACVETSKYFAREGQDDLAAASAYWETFYRDTLDALQAIDGNLLGAFRTLMNQEHIEIITCAATHGYLPLLGNDESVDLQLRAALHSHVAHFGAQPQGVWLPECGYRPRYHWLPPVGQLRQQRRVLRQGLEENIAACGLRFFFTDSHLAVGGRPLAPYRDYFPHLTALRETDREDWPYRTAISPFRTYRVSSREGTRSAAAFIREPESALQVWDRQRGYAGDPWYLEFHRKHTTGGLMLWRVGDKGDLATKGAYVSERARERTEEHASHFATLVAAELRAHRQSQNAPGVVCAPYDAELFGHWWHEGPHWLRLLYPALAREQIEPVTCSSYLQRQPPRESITLPEGSWGEGGDHRTWLNNDTAWMWERLYDSEVEFWAAVRQRPEPIQQPLSRVLCQAARELLLMQASDWPFLITSLTARDYAEQRFTSHYSDFKRLIDMARLVRERGRLEQDEWVYLASKEQQDFLLPQMQQLLFG